MLVIKILLAHTHDVRKVLITNDKIYAVCSSDDYTVGIWNGKDKILEVVLKGHPR